MTTRIKVSIVALAVLLAGAAFYWYDLRPKWIHAACQHEVADFINEERSDSHSFEELLPVFQYRFDRCVRLRMIPT